MPKQKRIAVIDRELCNPKTTGYACMKACPVNRSGDECVTLSEDQKPLIDESMCIGCGICVRKCSRNAISVVNLPEELNEDPVHRFGRNMFALYRLPTPRHNAVIGLIGPNGTGKSTVLNILSGNLRPNSGTFGSKASWEQILERFRGTELHEYLERLSKGEIKAGLKPQQVDLIPKLLKGKVSGVLKKADERKAMKTVVENLRIGEMLDKEISSLSGGELQLLAVSAAILKKADFYFFDEPSSYLDVEQRLRVAMEIRKLSEESVVMVIEHDLAVADYLADYTQILYGKPSVFGIVSKPYGVRIGINTFLEGFIREENVRFRDEQITFPRRAKAASKDRLFLSFTGFEKSFGAFSLKTEPGNIYRGEIIGILGPNSIGKTTMIRMLSGELKPDKGEPVKGMKLSFKRQRLVIEPDRENSLVSEYLSQHGKTSSPESKRILRYLGIEKLLERKVSSLSGGELQSVFIACALIEEHDILLLDEPSAFLDVEQRLRVAKLIREHAESREIPCFVVDHDLQFIDVISDRVMVFEGERGVKGYSPAPVPLEEGMNSFLKTLGITYRRDPHTGRPRANKPGSQKDQDQKRSGKYYYEE